MKGTHIYENIALTAFLILLVTEIVGVCYVTSYLYVNVNQWLLNIIGLFAPWANWAWPTGNLPRFARLNTSAGPQYFVEYPHDYRFVVDEPGKCREQEPFVVLIVPVHPNNTADRDVIRRTWGNETRRPVAGKTVSLFFLLGMPTGEGAERVQRRVLEESGEHRDLLQGDFLDSYRNLTVKTMVMMEWLDSRCAGAASYAAKVDTDVFLNVRNLVDMLAEAPEGNYMTGAVARWGPTVRDAGSKWYLPRDVYPERHYPPYAMGPGYVFSLDLPRKLVEASGHVKAVFMEDVYVGLCMEYLGIPLTDPPRRSLFLPWSELYGLCSYSEAVVAEIWPSHLDTADRMTLWEDFKRLVPYCSASHRLRA